MLLGRDGADRGCAEVRKALGVMSLGGDLPQQIS